MYCQRRIAIICGGICTHTLVGEHCCKRIVGCNTEVRGADICQCMDPIICQGLCGSEFDTEMFCRVVQVYCSLAILHCAELDPCVVPDIRVIFVGKYTGTSTHVIPEVCCEFTVMDEIG